MFCTAFEFWGTSNPRYYEKQGSQVQNYDILVKEDVVES